MKLPFSKAEKWPRDTKGCTPHCQLDQGGSGSAAEVPKKSGWEDSLNHHTNAWGSRGSQVLFIT